jgi:hypothetical protein
VRFRAGVRAAENASPRGHISRAALLSGKALPPDRVPFAVQDDCGEPDHISCSGIGAGADGIDRSVGMALLRTPPDRLRRNLMRTRQPGRQLAPNGSICAPLGSPGYDHQPARNRRTLESGHTIPGRCEGSSSWTCSRVGFPCRRQGKRRSDKGNRGSCRRRRCSRERVHDKATRPEKRHHGHAMSAPEYRRSAQP